MTLMSASALAATEVVTGGFEVLICGTPNGVYHRLATTNKRKNSQDDEGHQQGVFNEILPDVLAPKTVQQLGHTTSAAFITLHAH